MPKRRKQDDTPANQTLAHHIVAASIEPASTPDFAAAQEQPCKAGAALLEEVVITARKTEESQQTAPIAVTALGSDQIDALKQRSLHDLNVGMPGVVLEDVPTQRNTENCAVRGIGMRSSIASFDPAVGIFVDGVYMGINNGIMLDAFDLESIQVLRGPQGKLFGRNTMGGTVLLATAAPSDEFSARLRTAVDGNPNGAGGLNTYVMGSVSGPLTDILSGKLVAYWNDDEGWFANNGFDGGDDLSPLLTRLYPQHPRPRELRPIFFGRPAEEAQSRDATCRMLHGHGLPRSRL